GSEAGKVTQKRPIPKRQRGQPRSKTLARVPTLSNLRQLLDCACPSGAFCSPLTRALRSPRIPDPKRQKRQPHSKTLARVSYTLKPAPPFGLRLSFGRFLFLVIQDIK